MFILFQLVIIALSILIGFGCTENENYANLKAFGDISGYEAFSGAGGTQVGSELNAGLNEGYRREYEGYGARSFEGCLLYTSRCV